MAPSSCIQEVWQDNLEEAFRQICEIAKTFRYVAMDTEFPGVVCEPLGTFNDDYEYQKIRRNVDLLKVIQVGLTFFNEDAKSPSPISTWQFNFHFDLGVDMFAESSIALLKKSGIQFARHRDEGIAVDQFVELLWGSWLIQSSHVCWLTFHGAFDFAYMVKMLTNSPLAESKSEFVDTVKVFFTNVYDSKLIMEACGRFRGGLQGLAEKLKIKRIGTQHQAGSDSLLTGEVFFQIRWVYFGDTMNPAFNGLIYGVTSAHLMFGYDGVQFYSSPSTPMRRIGFICT